MLTWDGIKVDVLSALITDQLHHSDVTQQLLKQWISTWNENKKACYDKGEKLLASILKRLLQRFFRELADNHKKL